MSHLVFVYGTLKRGQPNHHVITDFKEGYKLIGEGQTQSKWPLVIASEFNIPFLLDSEGEGHNVAGEVYEVNDSVFAKLDELEGYPGFYDRRQVSIAMTTPANDTTSHQVLQCWLYFLPKFKPDMKDLEKYSNYDSYGAHGKPYVERYWRNDGWFEDKVEPLL
ncbi:putative gamma-glutamylcyclotransferase CG2811 [Diadema antillarum]|uniref:putative gamma-glutamylcyclotransferase CG2811 n=1 Tax=Diadema antillarum TaxID=105358 RepID=UPI003A8B70DF